MKPLRAVLTLIIGAVLVSTLLAGTSEARPLGANGRPPGSASSPATAECRYKAAWSTLQLSIGGPTVRVNRTVQVRYSLLAQNAVNGQPVAAVRSRYVTIRQGRSYTFGPGNVQVPWRQNVKLFTIVEFIGNKGTVGFVADRYQYFNGNNIGPIGSFSSCYRS